MLEQVAPVVEDGLSLTAVRARIKKLQESVAVLKRVPIPAPDIRQKVQSYVQGLTRPIIGGIDAGEVLTVRWPTELHVLMAFLQPEVLVERLMAEINRIANTPCALPEREQRIAELEQQIDRMQRTEEAIVVSHRRATRTRMPGMGRAGRQGSRDARRPRCVMRRASALGSRSVCAPEIVEADAAGRPSDADRSERRRH